MRITETITRETAETIRKATGRWLGKAIGLIRHPNQSYEQQVRELWQNQPRENEQDFPGDWN